MICISGGYQDLSTGWNQFFFTYVGAGPGPLVSGCLVSRFLVSGFWVSGFLVSGFWFLGFWVSGFWVSGFWFLGFWVSGFGFFALVSPCRVFVFLFCWFLIWSVLAGFGGV